MHRIDAPVESRYVVSADGIRIRAHRCGSGPHRWLLAPGLGTPPYAFRQLIEYFHERMTIVTWEQRGCFRSECPRNLLRLGMDAHIGDAVAVA
ncbi:alpha/beta fold hydrolase, partial [Planctomycetota bacterium]